MDAPARIQLRYNRGYGIRQQGISTRFLEAKDEFTRVRFAIQANNARHLQLVNFGVGHSLDLRSLTLEPLGGPARSLTAAELSSQTPGTQISQVADVIHIASNGTIERRFRASIDDIQFKASRIARLLQWIFVIPLFFSAFGLADTLCGTRRTNGRRRVSRWIGLTDVPVACGRLLLERSCLVIAPRVSWV